ncbi:MAG TPA: hypothetical protein VFJ46_17845 [Xanthobacteraceae bacterium]|nr:hypothetical protein [Xanthobacteraceae bacterium]
MTKELRDQSAHAAAAVVGLLPLAFAPGALTGAWAGFCMGVVRELTEEGEISLPALRRALRSRLDLTFWTLGGLLAGAAA